MSQGYGTVFNKNSLGFQEITKIYQIDVKGGNGQYKPIIKLSNLKKEIIEESVLENENEEGEGHQNEGGEGQQESHEFIVL